MRETQAATPVECATLMCHVGERLALLIVVVVAACISKKRKKKVKPTRDWQIFETEKKEIENNHARHRVCHARRPIDQR